MKAFVTASLAALGCAFLQTAATAAEEKPVPITKAAYHRPVFTNDYITMLDVYIPPGRNSLFHTHSQDSVSVMLSPAMQTSQTYGSDVVNPPGGGGVKGRVSAANYVEEGPRTHKATNVGTTPFHVVSFLLSSPMPYGNTVSTRNVAGYEQILDNNRVRGWRVKLDPGQSTGQITQRAPGLRIVIETGEIAEVVPGIADRGMWLGEGQYFWQDAGTTRSIKNIGTKPVEFVEFELK